MKLDDYIHRERLTNAQFGELVGANHSTIARLRAGGQVPAPPLMEAIHRVTFGEVQPNDFYSIGNAA